MKVSLPQKWIFRLSSQQKVLLLGLSIVLGFAVIYYFQWAVYLTDVKDSKVSIEQPARYFWWANDSVSYRNAGDWIFGRIKSDVISYRPWLYPLLIGLARTLFGGRAETVLWLVQFLMWLASGACLFLALNNTTYSIPLSMIGAGLFYVHPSPLILTFHGMTETLNIFLIALFIWVLTTAFPNRLYYAILLIALATVTKPIYLVFLIVLLVIVFIQNHETPKQRQLSLFVLLLTPVWIQLLLSFSVSGRFTISQIGGYTFKNYLVADVYLRDKGIEWRDATTQIKEWTTGQQLNYLWGRKRETLTVFFDHLIYSNMLTGSFFTLGENNRMDGFATAMNKIAAYLHLLMLPPVLYYLFSPQYAKNKQVIALLYLCFAIQWLTSGISTGQEDRLMMTAIPLWVIAYLMVFSGFSSPRQG